VEELGISREGDGLWLRRDVDHDPCQVLGARRVALVRDPQALGQHQLQLVAQSLAPVTEVRALVRKLMLKELFPGEVLEIRVMHPALSHAFVGQAINVLEQQQFDREAGLDPRPALVAV